MSWLAVLKNTQTPEIDATEPTESIHEITDSSGIDATETTERVSVAFVAWSQRETEKFASPGTWPDGDAWSAQEVDRFQQRLALLTDRGLSLDDAEHLAERLLQRDREGDDRRLCLECAHYRRGQCGNWRAAGFVQAQGVALGEMAHTLQRCPGFKEMRHDP